MSTQRNPQGASPAASQGPATGTDAQGRGAGAPRSLVTISLILALVFTVAVLGGAKILSDRQKYSDVSVGAVDAPDAKASECSQLVEKAPEKAGKFRKVGILDPVPDGTVAYRDTNGTQLTVRCGVTMPDQYTVISPVSAAEGASWFIAQDATPGSTLATWYSVSGEPTVAVTSEADGDLIKDAVADLSPVLGDVATSESPVVPAALPLADEPVAKDRNEQTCRSFDEALPAEIAGFRRLSSEELGELMENNAKAVGGEDALRNPQLTDLIEQANRAAKDSLVVYQPEEEGNEPVVVRCGVAFPESYERGERLSQIDDVPWFDAPALAQGSTIGHWYAIGHEEVVAVAMPQFSSGDVLPTVTKAITESMSNPPARASRGATPAPGPPGAAAPANRPPRGPGRAFLLS